MKTELSLVVMAGGVLSLFLIVGEVAAMRKRAKGVYARLAHRYRSGNYLSMLLELLAIAAFFLVQPFIIAILVAMAMDGLQSDFSDTVIRQIREAL